jgi:hypothetical protein
LLFTECDDVRNSFDFFGLIGGEVGKLLISYNDKSTRSNLRKHRNFVSIGGIETVGFSGLSRRGSLIVNGGTRGGIGSDEAFPVSKQRKINMFNHISSSLMIILPFISLSFSLSLFSGCVYKGIFFM